MKSILFVIGIVILFGLGPFGFLNVLDTGVSLKYEIDQPRAMGLEINHDLDELERYYNIRLFIFWTLTVLGPVSAITLLILKARRTK